MYVSILRLLSLLRQPQQQQQPNKNRR
jgi:hypothetical protein